MHGGRPAAGQAEAVASDTPCGTGNSSRVVDRRGLDPGELPAAAGANHRLPGEERYAPIFKGAGRLATELRPRIDDGGHLDPRIGQVQGGGSSAVVVGEDCRPAARRHRVTLEVAARGGGQQDARRVVAGENQGPLDGAGGEHDPPS